MKRMVKLHSSFMSEAWNDLPAKDKMKCMKFDVQGLIAHADIFLMEMVDKELKKLDE